MTANEGEEREAAERAINRLWTLAYGQPPFRPANDSHWAVF